MIATSAAATMASGILIERGLPCAGRMARKGVARVDVLLRLLETVPEIDRRLIPV